ncbi:MAG: WD40/YVTN/BNR-like repeat-containing protein [Myxococcales bacterium]
MRFSLLAIAAAALCPFARAIADGAFPDELSVMLPENVPNEILLGTNFGLVISQDQGKSWRYVCEPYITGSVNDNVNFYQAAKNGTVIATSFNGFWRSEDGGCTWTRAGATAALVARDLFIDANDPLFVVAIAANLSAGRADEVRVSHDGGITFQGPVYSTPNRLSGVEIARSDRNVVYVTEISDDPRAAAEAFLLTSLDGGQTFDAVNRVQLPVPPGTEVTIAAVDPKLAGTVYLRLQNGLQRSDAVAVTADRGATLTNALTITGTTVLSTFLIAADGTLLAGTTSSDLYAAPAGTTAFQKRTGPRARCLGQRAGDPAAPIYACGDGFLDGYNLGISIDGAQTFTPVMKFTDIAGPLTCPAVTQACAAQFALLQQTLGIAPPPAPPPSSGGGGGSPAKPGCSSAGGGTILGLVALALGRRRKRV